MWAFRIKPKDFSGRIRALGVLGRDDLARCREWVVLGVGRVVAQLQDPDAESLSRVHRGKSAG
jgi:hypothetical protein